ncbi:MAG: hypothetical protein M1833_001097 [Piccolia ochrophora]|nr:MAG: hypothetical protein M1833_001097 [Piccolia ochrophora]
MLTSHPRHPAPLSTPPFSHNEHQLYARVHSPSTLTLAGPHTADFAFYTPSPGDLGGPRHGQQHSDLAPSPAYVKPRSASPALNPSGIGQSMPASPRQLQSPPIRLLRSSPTPAPALRASRRPSALQSSMLSDSVVPQASWRLHDNDLGESAYGRTQSRRPADRGANSHYRAHSGSSVGSAGPASPFDSTTSNPYITRSDSSMSPAGTELPYYDGLAAADQAPMTFSKPLPTPTHTPSQESFLAPAFENYNPHTQDTMSNLEAKMAMYQALREQASGDHDSPVPGFSSPGRPSVSSMEYHSPATPQTTFGDDAEEGIKTRRSGEDQFPNVDPWLTEYLRLDDISDLRTSTPKLDRTMSDMYQEDLFNVTAFVPTTSVPLSEGGAGGNQLLSPYRNVFAERIQAANQEHLHAQSQSPASSVSRERSPFRQGSQYAPATGNYDTRSPLREPQQLGTEIEAHVLRQPAQPEGFLSTPKTISPKDALLEYHESEEDAKMPLFPPSATGHESITGDGGFGSTASGRRSNSSVFPASAGMGQAVSSNFTFVPPSVPGGVQLPQQYPFISQRRRPVQRSHSGPRPDQTPEFPAQLASMESSVSDFAPDSSGDSKKPVGATADSGTYTCTYHGCTLRFETPAKLQKHKREGHRQATPGQHHHHHHQQPPQPAHHQQRQQAQQQQQQQQQPPPSSPQARSPSSGVENGMTSAALMRNSQAGPHKCERVNPSTGKPCNTIFSRPYDLTRHEDTIHNARKQKVRCQLCTEDKSFSRHDALTRHMRVVHPDVDFGSKLRRRPQAS